MQPDSIILPCAITSSESELKELLPSPLQSSSVFFFFVCFIIILFLFFWRVAGGKMTSLLVTYGFSAKHL